MTDVKELRKKRSSYKGRLTVFSTFLNKLQDSTVSPSQVMELQLRVNKLEDLYNEFNEIQLQLECMCEIDAEALERTSIESQYYELVAQAKSIVDNVNKNIRALKTLGEPVDSWDTLLIYIIRQKLDTKTFREWEEYKGRIDKSKRITFDQFIEFMRNRAELIETLEKSRHSTNTHTNTKQNTKIKS
ncbi:hypothetical protein SFRURICE_011230, partial [Spodoptera frugiperda]